MTDTEVKEALFSMDDMKAPGLDGFNILFFKKTGHVISSSVTAAIQYFFIFGELPKQINCCALVTLIPKIPNASRVKEYRPIACCSMLYKIISKIISNRMQHVIPNIINDAQSAFVKGRVSSIMLL